jgi:hypothetical protein
MSARLLLLLLQSRSMQLGRQPLIGTPRVTAGPGELRPTQAAAQRACCSCWLKGPPAAAGLHPRGVCDGPQPPAPTGTPTRDTLAAERRHTHARTQCDTWGGKHAACCGQRARHCVTATSTHLVTYSSNRKTQGNAQQDGGRQSTATGDRTRGGMQGGERKKRR